MKEKIFEPFMDRLSRDIRNALSESLVDVLKKKSLVPAQQVAEQFRSRELERYYLDYIDVRLQKYEQALGVIAASENTDPLWQGFVLWDLGLFFEVHEILEHAWLASAGDEKMLLQAMIRAAGVYIKLEHGYDAAAAKISAKAVPVLEKNRKRLTAYIDPEILLTALRQVNKQPPILLQG